MKLVEVSHVDSKFREPFIVRGYRDPAAGWTEHAKSFLCLHNETSNIWTHSVSFLGFFSHLIFSMFTWASIFDASHAPMILLLISFCGFTLSSATAHLLSGKSTIVRDCLYFIDYTAIFFHAWTSALAYAAYSRLFANETQRLIFVLIISIVVVLGTFFACFSRFGETETHYKGLRLTALALPYVLNHSPMIYSLIFYGLNEAVEMHVGQITFAIIAVFFYASHVPERFCPGVLDFLFNSHTIFHVLISLAAVFETVAVKDDFHKSKEEVLIGNGAISYQFAMALIVVQVSIVAGCFQKAYSVHLRKIKLK